jgi:uncharacterized protein (TIGR02679 family)
MRSEHKKDLLALLNHSDLQRFMAALHASYRRNDRPAGQQKVVSYEESGALADLIGKVVKPGKSIKVVEIDRLLRENTRFQCSLHEALELHADQPVVSARRIRALKKAEWEDTYDRCFEVVRDLGLPPEAYARVVTWLHGAKRGLRAHFNRWRDEGFAHVRTVAAVFGRLPGRSGTTVYLSQLAAEVAGGQHGLDTRKPAGRLLYFALAYTFPDTAQQAKHRSALWRTNLLTEAGIARDPVSSFVHTYGLDGETAYLRELRATGYDRPVTLLTLRSIGDDVRAWEGVAFVVENPTVYAALIESLERIDRRYRPTLICTTGNLNLADLSLLDALVRNGAHLYYSGDFDKAGLDIMAGVLTRHPTAASPWRMTPADYLLAMRDDETLDTKSLQRLAVRFPDLVREMVLRGRPGDQEKLIVPLAKDLKRFVMDGVAPPRVNDPHGGSSAEHRTPTHSGL